jgi:hypothetical protein
MTSGLFVPVFANDLPELTEASYAESATSKGVVLVQVNWGRQWKCGGFDNAQLQRLTFSRLPLPKGAAPSVDLEFSIPSTLFAKNVFIPHALLLEPGEYALTGFDIKVARSLFDVAHIVGSAGDLVKAGVPLGGTFTIGKSEIVYIGEFGLDCLQQPIPWRYYKEGGRREFEEYIAGFYDVYPFVKKSQAKWRLFSTQMFGQPHELPDNDPSSVRK